MSRFAPLRLLAPVVLLCVGPALAGGPSPATHTFTLDLLVEHRAEGSRQNGAFAGKALSSQGIRVVATNAGNATTTTDGAGRASLRLTVKDGQDLKLRLETTSSRSNVSNYRGIFRGWRTITKTITLTPAVVAKERHTERVTVNSGELFGRAVAIQDAGHRLWAHANRVTGERGGLQRYRMTSSGATHARDATHVYVRDAAAQRDLTSVAYGTFLARLARANQGLPDVRGRISLRDVIGAPDKSFATGYAYAMAIPGLQRLADEQRLGIQVRDIPSRAGPAGESHPKLGLSGQTWTDRGQNAPLNVLCALNDVIDATGDAKGVAGGADTWNPTDSGPFSRDMQQRVYRAVKRARADRKPLSYRNVIDRLFDDVVALPVLATSAHNGIRMP